MALCSTPQRRRATLLSSLCPCCPFSSLFLSLSWLLTFGCTPKTMAQRKRRQGGGGTGNWNYGRVVSSPHFGCGPRPTWHDSTAFSLCLSLPQKIQWRFMCPLQLRFLLCGPAASAAATAAFSSITEGVCLSRGGGVGGAVGQLVSNSISWLLHALCAIYATHFRARHERTKKPFTQYNKPKT